MNIRHYLDLARPMRAHPWAAMATAIPLLVIALVVSGCSRSTDAQSTLPGPPRPDMSIERPSQEKVRLPFTISGWAVDRAAVEGPGIEVVEIVDEGCRGPVIGIAEYGLERPDIERRFGEQFRYSGWQFEVMRLRPGDHTLAVRSKSVGADDYNQCQAIPLTVLAD